MAKASKTDPISRLPRLKVYAYADADEMARAKVKKMGQYGDNIDKDMYSGSHVVDKYFEMLSEDNPGTETRAYLVESVARCIIKQIEGR